MAENDFLVEVTFKSTNDENFFKKVLLKQVLNT